MGTLRAWTSFKKRRNSTKQPPEDKDTDYTEFTIYLKQGTSIQHPTFLLEDTYDMSKPINYVKWQHHYYFVDDIVLGNKNIYELQCTEDVLATFKSDILDANQYVLRSASKSNGNVIDGMFPATGVTTMSGAYSTDRLFPYSIGSGYYILGIINNSATAVGAVSYYCLTNTQMRNLMSKILGSTSYMGTPGIADDLLKSEFNPFQYVASCMWSPWAPQLMGDAVAIGLGWYDTGAAGNIMGSSSVTQEHTLSFTIPKHPQDSRGNYLNCAPFTSHVLEAGPFGTVVLDANELASASTLNLKVMVDTISGMGRLSIGSDVRSDLMIVRGQVGVPIQLGQVTTNYLGAISSLATGVMGAAGSAATGNAVGVIGSMTSGVINAIESTIPKVQTSGSNGNFAQLFEDIFLHSSFKHVSGSDDTHLGKPYCDNITLSSLSGYTLCKNASVLVDGFGSEKEEINNYLNTGFYIE